MKKKWVYTILFVSLLLSFFYDKQMTLLIAENRISMLNGFAIWLTSPLTIITVFLLMTTLFLWEERKRKWIIPLWASIIATGALTVLIKFFTHRARPFEELTTPLIQGIDYTFSFWNTSFPSMHTAAAFSLVPILDKEFPKLKWFWITMAILISFSRVYVGVHYVSDTLAGCMIGLLIGYGIIQIEKKYGTAIRWKKKKN
ncbi:MAG: phosphatase PAP2 family protein [Nanoarchaeota archaeon]|nr:phosphatase PAP2 family protein [Nanoarchaeota archaeon]